MTLGYIADTINNARCQSWKWLDNITRKNSEDAINIPKGEMKDLLNAMEELLEMVSKLEIDRVYAKRNDG